ncbi:MAG: ribonuclease HII [Acidobacteria bacterium]|nr:ribonuclease HII [Acidobacteriota bacterium]
MPIVEEILQQSVIALKACFLDGNQVLPKGLLEALEGDHRQGARDLAVRLRARQSENRAEGQRLRHLLKFESELWGQGFEFIAGVDEAGVGPLAGPVVAGAVILPRDYKLRELDDSKKLDEVKRDLLAERIKADAVAWAIGIAEVKEIDRLNIYQAGLLAMRRAVEALNAKPGFVLVDARTIPELTVPQRGIVRGDSLSASIAAASILAKTTRDALMLELDRQFPGYGLAGHKGYPTPMHFAALKKLGASPAHRRSFRPVREVLGLDPQQVSLFDS